MWGLIRKDLGEFVSTLKDDATVTLKSAIALGEDYEGSVRLLFIHTTKLCVDASGEVHSFASLFAFFIMF